MLPVSVTPRPAVVRTEMDVGPPKQRRRSTLVWKDIQARMVLSGTQLQTFLAFWDQDLAQGALAFDWYDPSTGDPAQLRFVTEEPPEWVQISPGDTQALKLWEAVFQLEVIPS